MFGLLPISGMPWFWNRFRGPQKVKRLTEYEPATSEESVLLPRFEVWIIKR